MVTVHWLCGKASCNEAGTMGASSYTFIQEPFYGTRYGRLMILWKIMLLFVSCSLPSSQFSVKLRMWCWLFGDVTGSCWCPFLWTANGCFKVCGDFK